MTQKIRNALVKFAGFSASLVAFGLISCGVNDEGAETAAVPVARLPNETDLGSKLGAVDLDKSKHGFIDIRGLGDAAWSGTHERTPIAAGFGKALDAMDPSGRFYRGDLTYINWESVVAENCAQFSAPYSPGRSYAFVSRVQNIEQAFNRGIQIFGLSNNHTRDCVRTASGASGAATTAAAMSNLQKTLPLMHHGVTGPAVALKTFQIKGRTFTMAFASLYNGRNDVCSQGVCGGSRTAVLQSLRDAKADIRVLAIHSQGSQADLVDLGTSFVEKYKGDIVFGSGPHRWAPVRVLRQQGTGKRGVVFESLGNFIHPSLAAQSQNMIGRVLLDPKTLELVQVQVIPVATSGSSASLNGKTLNGASAGANINLKNTPALQGAFANVKRPAPSVALRK